MFSPKASALTTQLISKAISQISDDGFAILHNIITANDAAILKQEAYNILHSFPKEAYPHTSYSFTRPHDIDHYYMSSISAIQPFICKEAFQNSIPFEQMKSYVEGIGNGMHNNKAYMT